LADGDIRIGCYFHFDAGTYLDDFFDNKLKYSVYIYESKYFLIYIFTPKLTAAKMEFKKNTQIFSTQH